MPKTPTLKRISDLGYRRLKTSIEKKPSKLEQRSHRLRGKGADTGPKDLRELLERARILRAGLAAAEFQAVDIAEFKTHGRP